MMATEKRLIDANALKIHRMHNAGANHPLDVAYRKDIDNAPTVDAVEVVHARNLRADSPSLFECSECGWSDCDTYTGDTAEYNYCPNCGAKMDGDGNGC